MVVTSVAEAGSGGGRHVLSLIKGVRESGRRVVAVCFQPGTLSQALRDEGVAVRVVPCRWALDPTAFLRLRRLILSYWPVIVHTHGERATFVGSWCAALVGVPRVVATVHRSIARTMNWSRLRRVVYQAVESLTLRRATTHIIAVSAAMRDDLVERGVPSGTISVIHNGFEHLPANLEKAVRERARAIRQDLGIGEGAFVVGSVGRFVPEKEYFLLIEAAAAVLEADSSVTFVLVGDGLERPAIEALVNSKGLQNKILLPGFQSRPLEWIAAFDAFVSSSPWESFGLAILEAMSLGVPVIASDSSGPRELLVAGESGLLVPVGDAKALTKAILRLSKDRDLGRRMSSFGRDAARSRFGIRRLVEQTSAVYGVRPGWLNG